MWPPRIMAKLSAEEKKEWYYLPAINSNEILGKKWCEIGIFIGLILGRWLMPRGNLSRDKHSALLLGYVGNAIDIMELFIGVDVSKTPLDVYCDKKSVPFNNTETGVKNLYLI